MLYALIYKSGILLGIFNSKEIMKATVETIIKEDYQKNGYYGNYNFRYIKFAPNEPWYSKKECDVKDLEAKALLSFSTMHDEYFPHRIFTDWSTGEILDMDSTKTTNV